MLETSIVNVFRWCEPNDNFQAAGAAFGSTGRIFTAFEGARGEVVEPSYGIWAIDEASEVRLTLGGTLVLLLAKGRATVRVEGKDTVELETGGVVTLRDGLTVHIAIVEPAEFLWGWNDALQSEGGENELRPGTWEGTPDMFRLDILHGRRIGMIRSTDVALDAGKFVFVAGEWVTQPWAKIIDYVNPGVEMHVVLAGSVTVASPDLSEAVHVPAGSAVILKRAQTSTWIINEDDSRTFFMLSGMNAADAPSQELNEDEEE
ncbi:hypothetical protein [Sphingobium nicotianae]|uniref:DUF861 domain-containing protein n=1 Tax=Sphingobium nicotianae TaxID=2782607 RepID=A0A9X1D9V3_9SPHN|nr:hypothetical protein [Sphingobium nicotianae]MBT2186040.1 hypothetical protein [Sphingobium nicotianae]